MKIIIKFELLYALNKTCFVMIHIDLINWCIRLYIDWSITLDIENKFHLGLLVFIFLILPSVKFDFPDELTSLEISGISSKQKSSIILFSAYL